MGGTGTILFSLIVMREGPLPPNPMFEVTNPAPAAKGRLCLLSLVKATPESGFTVTCHHAGGVRRSGAAAGAVYWFYLGFAMWE